MKYVVKLYNIQETICHPVISEAFPAYSGNHSCHFFTIYFLHFYIYLKQVHVYHFADGRVCEFRYHGTIYPNQPVPFLNSCSLCSTSFHWAYCKFAFLTYTSEIREYFYDGITERADFDTFLYVYMKLLHFYRPLAVCWGPGQVHLSWCGRDGEASILPHD